MPCAPNSAPPVTVSTPVHATILSLHSYLIGLRRRHPWLHEARTTALFSWRISSYVFESRCGDDALIVALNLDDAAVALPVAELTGRPAEVIAGTGAPPQEVVSHTEVAPHGAG